MAQLIAMCVAAASWLVLGVFYMIVVAVLMLPGALVAGDYENMNNKLRKRIGYALILAGALTGTLCYTATVAAFTHYQITGFITNKFLISLDWIMEMGAALSPAYWGTKGLLMSLNSDEVTSSSQKLAYKALCVCTVINSLAFIVFAVWPSAILTLWKWVPYAGMMQSAAR